VSSGPGQKTVPSLAGEPAAEAKRSLHLDGFRYSQTSQPSASVQKGHVISTSPTAGSTTGSGSVVQLNVSSGAPLVSLVNVVSLQYTNAQDILLADGFKVKKQGVSSTVTAGQVLAESPSTAKAPQGSTITLDVAEAPTRIAVPDVEGDTEQVAVATLQTALLTPATSSEPTTNPADNGLVLSETPAPGSMVKKGSIVALEIGSYSASTGNSGTTGATGST
ncbi:MAG TPA: PASTA domain-containing protein, partial [Solirubrobacteraceae bacterium]|nr:PASTA domain-containing protein [Solirubrobacteraceae bacterium]